MRKFTPLDLSFIAAAGSPERESIRNTAAMIHSLAGWSQPSNAMMAEYKQMQDAEAAKHKPTFVSGLFDLLSTPLYGVANALDESIAGHQKDSNDSILRDVGQVVGGLGTGLVRGVGAGLRGATSMLESLPGVDISDEWQLNPEDKTRFSDVAIREQTGLSSKEAAKEENWPKVAKALEKSKNEPWWQKSGSSYLIPSNLDDPEARAEYFKAQRLSGIGADILGDPLNFLSLGAKSALTAPKTIAEGVEAARGAERLGGIGAAREAGPTFAAAPDLPKMADIPSSEFLRKAGTEGISFPKTKVDIPATGPVEALPKLEAGLQPNIATSLIPKGAEAKPLSTLGRRAGAPKAGFAIAPLAQKKLVSDIAKLAESGKSDWIYRAGDLLAKHPGVEFTNTTRFLDMANKMAKAKGAKHSAAKMAPVLAARIAQDATKVAPAEHILNTVEPLDVIVQGRKVIGADKLTKLRPQQLEVANEVIKDFAPQILGKEMAPGTGAALARAQEAGFNARYSGPNQVRLWNQLTTKFKNLPDNVRYQVAAKTLQHIEDYFISKGAIPYSGEKVRESVEGLRLSHIAMALGPKTLADNPNLVTRILKGDETALASLTAEELQKIEALKAGEAMASAPATQQGITAGKNAAADIMSKVQSAGRMQDELRQASKIASETAARAGAGPVASRVAGEYIERLVRNPGSIDAFYRSKSLETVAVLSAAKKAGKVAAKAAAKADREFAKKVANYVAKAAELPPPATLGKLSGPAASVSEGLGALFNAAYGVKDMRHIFLREQASALSTSARRSQFINQLGRVFSPKDVDLWHEAFRAAQANGITAGRVSELQAEIAKIMESLAGGTGLKAGAIADSTVVGRGRLTMAELNESLTRFGIGHQFEAGKKVKDALGVVRDLSKGADWLKSWESWNIKDPYKFLHQFQQAVEHTVRQKSMFDEIGTRFGSINRFGDVKYAIDHPRLKGLYFNEEGAHQGAQFVKLLKEINTPSSKALQHIDHVISKLKAALTIYIPSHHWTNLIGDLAFNWYAGVNKPQRYDQALKVFNSQRGRYGDITSFQQGIAGPDALKQAMLRGEIGTEGLASAGLAPHAAGNSTIITMQNGTKVTADMVYAAAFREGILPSAKVLEEVASETTNILDKIHLPGAAKGVVQGKVHQISEFRDHVPRLAQFIDGIAKSGGSFANAVEHSAANVRKWHPDGLDLTKFERQVMKRIFPFYSWTRKAVPLAIESAIVASPKVMAYPRLMEALSTSMGIEGEGGGAGGTFPSDQMFPDWLRERGIGPVAGGPGSYLTVNPSMPTLDIATMLGRPGGTLLDMLNPIAKVPLELAQGATLGKQVPIDNQANYLAQQIPGVSQIGRVTGSYGTSKSVADSSEQQMLNLINLLTGAKATQTGIYQKSAQFDLKDYMHQKAKAAKG